MIELVKPEALAVGVPVIAPVCWLTVKPAGKNEPFVKIKVGEVKKPNVIGAAIAIGRPTEPSAARVEGMRPPPPEQLLGTGTPPLFPPEGVPDKAELHAPAPIALTARTFTLYCVPFERLGIVIEKKFPFDPEGRATFVKVFPLSVV